MRYDEPVFRPPSEAYSAILQVTLGCSWNRCTFCEMYTSKKFRLRPSEDVKADIKALAGYYAGTKRVFLADGNAFVLSANKLIPVLDEINKCFGKLQRISSYAMPRDVIAKTDEELKEIRSKGLKLLYIGIESGDDEVLAMINKGETFESTAAGIEKAHKAGFDTSLMVLNGLGGKRFSSQHAINSARLVSRLNPKYLSTLTLSFPFGDEHFKSRTPALFEQLTLKEILEEQKLFIENIEAKDVIFRSNHVSNNLLLEGILNKDKENLVQQLEFAIRDTPAGVYPTSHGMF